MLNFSIPLSSLRSHQVAMNVVGHNIANANTPGYSRQEARFATRGSINYWGHLVGQGVKISEIHRYYDEATEAAYLDNASDMKSLEGQLEVARDLEAILNPGPGSLMAEMDEFFEQVQRLTAHPDDVSSHSIVVQAAVRIADQINRLGSAIEGVQRQADNRIEEILNQIEQKSAEITALDSQIGAAEALGQSPNSLRDERNARLRELADLIDVEVSTQRSTIDGQTRTENVYRLADGFLSFSVDPIELSTVESKDGALSIRRAGQQRDFPVTSGELGGLIEVRNGLTGDYQAKLAEFTEKFLARIDTVHATGVGLGSGYDSLVGQRRIDDTSANLADLDSFIPIKSGDLFVTVVHPDGNSELHRIEVDAQSMSAETLALALDSVDHINASISTSTDQLNLSAQAGYKFNFSGLLPTIFDTSGMTGTANVELSGAYDGDSNRDISVRFTGSGMIGVSNELYLEVVDVEGAVIARHDVGAGYEAGSELTVSGGVSLKVGRGDVNAGDFIESTLVAEADTTGVLAAFGLNSLFVGDAIGRLGVNQELLDDPSRLAVRHYGNPLDTHNALRMLGVQDERLFGDGTQTAQQFFSSMISQVGTDVNQLELGQDTLVANADAIEAKQQALSGVDTNEELVKMLQYQKAFQASARVIVTIQEMLDELFNMTR